MLPGVSIRAHLAGCDSDFTMDFSEMRNCVTIVRPAASAGARRGQRGQLDGVPLTALLASTLGALINWENTPSKEAGDNNITDTFIS